MKTIYLCDGEIPECKKTNCYLIGGECKHTLNIEHAKNFDDLKNSSFMLIGKEINVELEGVNF